MKGFPMEVGRAVLSKAGRDAGRRFVVLRTEGPYGFLADGETHKAGKPKKKKQMHLRPLPEFYPDIAEMIAAGGMPTDAQLRKHLAELPQRED